MISAEEIKALMVKDENGLLPCPFCGEKTIYLNQPHEKFRGSINCPSCLVSLPNECNDYVELISCWNHRTYTPASSTLQTLLNQAAEALAFYADEKNYNDNGAPFIERTVEKHHGVQSLDIGKIATKTLAAIEPYLTKEGV